MPLSISTLRLQKTFVTGVVLYRNAYRYDVGNTDMLPKKSKSSCDLLRITLPSFHDMLINMKNVYAFI